MSGGMVLSILMVSGLQTRRSWSLWGVMASEVLRPHQLGLGSRAGHRPLFSLPPHSQARWAAAGPLDQGQTGGGQAGGGKPSGTAKKKGIVCRNPTKGQGHNVGDSSGRKTRLSFYQLLLNSPLDLILSHFAPNK